MASFLSVFLLVLKIIGFVLLGILAFILLILLVVCLVPVRYKGKVSYKEKANGFFRVTWLLHAVSAKVLITDNKFGLKIRILGFIRIGEKKKAEAEPADEGTDGDSPETDTISETASHETEDSGSEPENSSSGAEEAESGHKKKRPSFIEFYRRKLSGLSDKASRKADELYEKFCEKYKEFWKKYRDIIKKLEFLEQEKVQLAIKHVMKHVLKILKCIPPKKIKGSLRLGLANPADTGMVYGIICSTMPIHKDCVKVTPNFEEKELDADLMLAGRIFIGFILIQAVAILLNRNVFYVLRNIKKYFGKKAEK